ncbi:protein DETOXIFICATION 42-like isoform X2 [Nymphaea colorata]|uniref:protein DETOXIFICATION 42-like isoform X2 n=1 Tax=Nymphaea colorata TaxID=210225 RepID=UPI00129DA5D4|nr:protein DETOXIFICATION 42-like isoform X2 [Nymphaea colorata]
MESNSNSLYFNDWRLVFRMDELGIEIAQIAFPAALALTADPIASLVDTAFIGQIGPVELAAVGVAIAVFNQASRIAIFPLVSVTTSFVAEEDATCQVPTNELTNLELEKGIRKEEEMKELLPKVEAYKSSCISSIDQKMKDEKRYYPSVSSALVIGGVLGILQATLLIIGAKPILNFMGVNSESPMLSPAQKYMTLRSLGAPAVLLSLASQGVFRGFRDTKTPLYATVVGDAINIILDPILMFIFKLGVTGAAIAHISSQYLIVCILLWKLSTQVQLLPTSIKELGFDRFLKSGFLLLARVIAVTFCVTLSASLAARQGAIPMAAFQICLQVWLATSLLADGLAIAGQAILAGAFAKGEHDKARIIASRVLQLGFVLGLILSIVLGVGLQFTSRLFTEDPRVMQLMHIGIPFVAVTQPINSMAFVFDGINFGASDFAYSAYSMVFVAILSIFVLLILSATYGFVGIWIGLTIYMALRMIAGFWRIGTARGPWSFLRS